MGVCGGITHQYSWSSTVVRLPTIVLATIIPIPGFGAISTLLLCLLLPETDEF